VQLAADNLPFSLKLVHLAQNAAFQSLIDQDSNALDQKTELP